MRSIFIVSLAGLGLGAALVTAAPLGTDYSSIPPAPAAVEKQIAEGGFSLPKALEAALKKSGGSATSCVLDLKTGKVEVTTFSAGKQHNLTVDAKSGEVLADLEVPAFVFPGDPVSSAWTETPSGLKYFELKVGDGDQPAPTSKVKVHYSGWLVDGKPFDSSVTRGQPAEFPLNGVIKGWTEGVGGMRVGGKRKLVLPYALAYGEGGRPPTIPPKAMLIFDVELLAITQK